MGSSSDQPFLVCPICSPPRQLNRQENFLDHVQRHARVGGFVQLPRFVEASALVDELQTRSDREKEKSKTGSEYSWPALRNTRINREAAEFAGRVRRRLRSEVVNFGSSAFNGDVRTLVSWGRDLVFFNADIRDPRVSRLVSAAWAPKIRSLGIKITPRAGDEREPDAIVKALRYLPNLREVYLISYDGLHDEDSGSDYGDEDEYGEENEHEAKRTRPRLRWHSLLTVNCLAEILARRRSGPITHPRDDFIQDLRPRLTIAEATMRGGAQIALLEEYAAEVNVVTAFLEKHWVDAISRDMYICARNIKVQWIL